MQSHVTKPLAATTDEHIRNSQEKVKARLSADPQAARTTITTTGRVDEGLACHVQQGKFSTVMDMGPAMGGTMRGPSPGFFARSAIIGCISIAIKMKAAQESLDVRSVNVIVETDFDDLGMFGLGSGRAAPLETRINIEIDTPETEDTISELVNWVLTFDPWFLALRDEQSVVVDTQIKR